MSLDIRTKDIQDEKELTEAKKFMLMQQQFYPNFDEWIDGKCMPRIDQGMYRGIITLSDGELVGILVVRDANEREIEIKNFRIDPEYRRRDIGNYMLTQLQFLNKNKDIITDVTAKNFTAVQFFIRQKFDIMGIKQLYLPGQDEYLLRYTHSSQ